MIGPVSIYRGSRAFRTFHDSSTGTLVVPGANAQGLTQLVTAEINPAGLGAAPALTNPATNDAPAGPRLLRWFAEGADPGGLRHGTLIDVSPLLGRPAAARIALRKKMMD